MSPPPESTRSERPALCVVNYNGSRYLRGSLGRIRELRDQFGEVVFVDDASTDDSLAVARETLPNARTVALAENRGPGPARNAGLAAVEARRVLFVDNDVLLDRHVLPRLSAALDSEPNAVMVMPRVVSAKDPDNIEYEGGDAHLSGLVSLRSAGLSAEAHANAPVAQVGSVITCCFLFDRSRWGPEPLFDEAFGMYGDDHELGLRARIRGRDLLAVPAAVCLHGEGTPGVSIRESGEYSALRIRNTILNRWQVLLKLYQTRTLILLAPYLALFEVGQLVGCVALGWHREWVRAGRELLGRFSSLRAQRRTLRRTRRRPDTMVLAGGPHPFNRRLADRAPLRVALPWLDAAAALNWAVVRFLPGGGRVG